MAVGERLCLHTYHRPIQWGQDFLLSRCPWHWKWTDPNSELDKAILHFKALNNFFKKSIFLSVSVSRKLIERDFIQNNRKLEMFKKNVTDKTPMFGLPVVTVMRQVL